MDKTFTPAEIEAQDAAWHALESLLLARTLRAWAKDAPLFTRVGELK